MPGLHQGGREKSSELTLRLKDNGFLASVDLYDHSFFMAFFSQEKGNMQFATKKNDKTEKLKKMCCMNTFKEYGMVQE